MESKCLIRILRGFNFHLGSTVVSLGAVIISAPIAIALAIFMNLISPKFGNKVLKPVLELLVGIPSVVYGLLGVTILVPLLRDSFGEWALV